MTLSAHTLDAATALYQSGQLQAAARACMEVLAREPANAKAVRLLGAVVLQTGRPEQALALLSRAIELDVSDAFAHNLLGNTHLTLGNHTEALRSYDESVALAPRYADAYYNRGCARLDLGRLEEAILDFDRVISINPESSRGYLNKGVAMANLGHADDAIHCFDQAIARNTGDAQAYYNRGRAWQDLQRYREAVSDYGAAIAIEPHYSAAYVNRAVALLAMGRLEEGWPDMEWRWTPGGSSLAAERRDFHQPQWRGELPIEGRTILLYSEQGLGDTLQFCRYVPMVAALGASVILEVPRVLWTLLKSLNGVDHLTSPGDALPNFDLHSPLLSLPLAFRTSLETIPAAIPYLKADPARVRRWEEKLGPNHARRVGLVWSGGFRPDRPDLWQVNARRNIPLGKLAALRLPGIEFFSLQKGQMAEDELATLVANNWAGPDIRNLSDELSEFAETAALIERLDLVISVDTSVAHLAGALGKPIWLLNRYDTCWRWLLDRTDSPWYPTARLYRQPRMGDWDSVVARITRDLAEFAYQRTAAHN